MGIYTAISLRWMLFIDGENIVMRGQQTANSNGISLPDGDYYRKDTYLWLPNSGRATTATSFNNFPGGLAKPHATRAFYYTSVQGDDVKIKDVRSMLHKIGFDPKVFKKISKDRSKGVDIALARDLLSNAFMNNYDLVALISGDGDYLPLIEEVKRLGKIVYVSAFSSGLNDELKLSADWFGLLDDIFIKQWSTITKM